MFELQPLKREADEIVSDLSKLLGSDFAPELVMKLFEAAMGPTQMRLYSVANFYAEECDKCRGAGAFFSACLMISSSVESLLALLCLQSQREAEKSKYFRGFPKAKTYEGRILMATFEQYIKLADHFDRVPSSAVDAEILRTSTTDFPLVAGALYPMATEKKIAEKSE